MVNAATYKKAAPWVIGYADASLSNSARVTIWQFTQWAASAYPQIKQVIRTNANDNPNHQSSDIQDLVSRGVNCLIVSATSTDAVNPAIEAASAAGIPVVIQERTVTTDKYTVFVNSVTRDIGRLQAESVAKILGGKGNVVLLEGLAGSGPAEEARKGHEEVLKKYPGIKVLATAYSGWDRATGKSTMEDWLQTYPKIDAVISDSGIQAMGAYEAVQAAGRVGQVKAWTGDSLQSWIRLVQKVHLPGVIVNRPLRFGATAVDACANLLAGNSVPREWLDPVEALDMNNLSKYIAPNTPGSDQWWDWWDLPAQWRQKQ
jgi:ribose transport system substrate-binding protein